MYEKSKEKYAVEMQLYSSRTKPSGDDIPAWCTTSNIVPDETVQMCLKGQATQQLAYWTHYHYNLPCLCQVIHT
jgi:hypothetical protein